MSLDEPVPADVAGTTTTEVDTGPGTAVVTSAPSVPAVPGTPSWLTGEFYQSLAPLVAGLITVALGKHVVAADVQEWLVAGGVIVVGAFALARTILKAVHVRSAATVAAAATTAAAHAAVPGPPVDLDALAAAIAEKLALPAPVTTRAGIQTTTSRRH